jgi:monoamine oxidase
LGTYDTDVLIVGAGLAGLTAARALRADGLTSLVLEARDRVGGRTHGGIFADGTGIDLGGEWVGPGQHRMASLLEEFSLETFHTYDNGANLFEFGDTLTEFTGINPGLSDAVFDDVSAAQQALAALAVEVPCDAPWQAARAQQLDVTTLSEWLHRTLSTPEGLRFMSGVVEGIWAVHPSQLSLLHVLFYINAAGGFERLANCDGGAQQDRVLGGSHMLAKRMAAELGDAVRLGVPVRRIVVESGRVRVECASAEITARRAVVAVAPMLTGRIMFDPPLPALRDGLQQRAPHGSVIKCAARYETPFWREAGLSGQVVGDAGPIRLTFDGSPPSGSPGVLLGFMEAEHAVRAAALSAEDRRAQVVKCFARFFGDAAGTPLEYVEQVWNAETWTRGCYSAVFGPGVWTTFGRALRDPIGPIHWAGTETATSWTGYMEGAIESGLRVATEIRDDLAKTRRNGD